MGARWYHMQRAFTLPPKRQQHGLLGICGGRQQSLIPAHHRSWKPRVGERVEIFAVAGLGGNDAAHERTVGR
jgi:hypothetical protein